MRASAHAAQPEAGASTTEQWLTQQGGMVHGVQLHISQTPDGQAARELRATQVIALGLCVSGRADQGPSFSALPEANCVILAAGHSKWEDGHSCPNYQRLTASYLLGCRT